METSTDSTMKASEQTTVAQEPSEKISDQDKAVLEQVKVKRELALEKAKAAVANSESAELLHQNVMLQLAMKYSLLQGDSIKEDGSIVRKAAE